MTYQEVDELRDKLNDIMSGFDDVTDGTKEDIVDEFIIHCESMADRESENA